eukprot:6491676-Amphidinium_carterae.4
MKDQHMYFVIGLPSGVVPEEVARVCSEQAWRVIPQRRVSQRDGRATWLVTTDAAPAQAFFRWGPNHVSIEKALEGDSRLQRKKKDTPKDVKTAQGPSAVPIVAHDPLMQSDPWKHSVASKQPTGKAENVRTDHNSGTGSSSSGSNPQSAQLWESWRAKASVQVQQHTTAPANDRVDQLARRVLQLEDSQAHITSKVDAVEEKVESLGTSMSSQFSQVLSQLSLIYTSQQSGQKRPPPEDGTGGADMNLS